MDLLKKTVIAGFVAISSGAFAGSMGSIPTNPPRFYAGLQVGDSISADTHFQPRITYPPAQSSGFVTPVNTDFTRDIGSEGFGGVFIGYNWRPGLAFQFSYDYRNGYDWTILAAEDSSLYSPDVYDRFTTSSIKIQTFLFDVILKPTVEWGGFVPYVKGGIGIASNKIKRLQNIDQPTRHNNHELTFNIVTAGKTATSFAWDAGVGVDYFVNDKISVALGYRLVDAGALKTGTTYYESVASVKGRITPFETRHVFLNEVSIAATYHFDFG